MNIKKLLALLLALCMMLGLLAGCGGGKTPANDDPDGTQGEANDPNEETAGISIIEGDPQYGGHLNVAVNRTIVGWDPHVHPQVWSYLYLGSVFDNPLTRDADNNIAPGVCNFELSEDKRTITLWVRDGVMFHDGTLVDIYDVEASIKRACNIGNSVKEYLAPAIESMVVEGEKLVIKFNGPSARALSRLSAYQIWLAVMPKEICEANPTAQIKDISSAVGTGPYKITEYETNVGITIERFDDYKPAEVDGTGYASIKHAYLDSITFHENTDYSSITMGLLSGQYDVSDVVEPEYRGTMEGQGIIRKNYGKVLTTYQCYFNNSGNDNICAKYPALRKAVMAAMDMYEVADTITDLACVVDGKGPLLDPAYDTTDYGDADWFGESNQDVVDKYLEEARAQGYDDEPIQLVSSSANVVYTLLTGYLEDAGINYKWNFMDSSAASEFLVDGKNNWDIQFLYGYGGFTPSTLPEEYISFYYVSEERDRVYNELLALEEGSDEYIAKWQELSKIMVDDCSIIHFGFLDWYWNHPVELHCEFEGPAAYFFNAYWVDPDNHPRT